MRRLTCNRVEELLFDYLDDSLEDPDRAAVAVHVAICDACRASAELCAGAVIAAREAPLPPSPAFEAAERLRHAVPDEDHDAGSRRVSASLRWAALAAGVAGIAAAGLWLASRVGPASRSPGTDGAPRSAVAVAQDVPVIETLDRAGRRAFELGPGLALRLGGGAVAEVVASDADEALFRLSAGSAIAEVGAIDPAFRFAVETPTARVEARGTVFSVALDASGQTAVRVASGCVEVSFRDGRGPLLLLAGEELPAGEREARPASVDALARDLAAALELDGAGGGAGVDVAASAAGDLPAATRAEAADAAEALVASIARAQARVASANASAEAERLLELAQAYRRAALFEDAVATYERLIAAHPVSEIGISALVALAQLEAHVLGRTEAARGHYARYLEAAPKGPLADVARRGLGR